MQGKVAVFGDADFVMPFSAMGLDTFTAPEENEELLETARKILAGKYALVVLAENIAPKVDEIFAVTKDRTTPCIVVVPFTQESEGFATKSLGAILKMATGIDILAN